MNNGVNETNEYNFYHSAVIYKIRVGFWKQDNKKHISNVKKKHYRLCSEMVTLTEIQSLGVNHLEMEKEVSH